MWQVLRAAGRLAGAAGRLGRGRRANYTVKIELILKLMVSSLIQKLINTFRFEKFL
jgi:hypothetical protein